MKTTEDILQAASVAKSFLPRLTTEKKNQALSLMAEELLSATEEILAANAQDVREAVPHLPPVMIDRLSLDVGRIAGMAEGIRALIDLPDPVGMTEESTIRPNGLLIEKVRVPFGVVAVIYESRPNVTADAGALCFKSGNVCILRGGKEAFRSAYAITSALRRGLCRAALPEDLIQLIEDTSRASADVLMGAIGRVDLLIPRGGAGLIRACVEHARVPVIQTGTGICHIYVERTADIPMALNIIENAKASRPSVCNAAEVCLVHRDIAPVFLPALADRLGEQRRQAGKPSVTLRADVAALPYLPEAEPARDGDFDTEFLDYILAVAVVDSTEDAIAHIAAHSTGHSEAILTTDEYAAARFTSAVDSAAVYVNASTRFTDGGEFGLGCEIGISTQKLHARGPMGLRELTTYRYVIRGNGQIR